MLTTILFSVGVLALFVGGYLAGYEGGYERGFEAGAQCEVDLQKLKTKGWVE